MTAEKNLEKMLQDLSPQLKAGEFVFCTFGETVYGDLSEFKPLAAFLESEGLTLVLDKATADARGLSYESVFRCITLNVHSSLDAVGLTAVCSARLAELGISANVIAAFYHDHFFVQTGYAEQALAALSELGR